ncbi:hypothetical protein B0H15DRAFT_854791 [Mycena belliarum]|uniref:Uncharacterized protein n=1 Tax=Mycena belliarum TaxID=1033014 RepID=A0AAD6TZ35_9AGAR|nr:hypothetical protein B0H15DRAFT_854791 [Mycena belliae]
MSRLTGRRREREGGQREVRRRRLARAETLHFLASMSSGKLEAPWGRNLGKGLRPTVRCGARGAPRPTKLDLRGLEADRASSCLLNSATKVSRNVRASGPRFRLIDISHYPQVSTRRADFKFNSSAPVIYEPKVLVPSQETSCTIFEYKIVKLTRAFKWHKVLEAN